jgi:hypothetical protein
MNVIQLGFALIYLNQSSENMKEHCCIVHEILGQIKYLLEIKTLSISIS